MELMSENELSAMLEGDIFGTPENPEPLPEGSEEHSVFLIDTRSDRGSTERSRQNAVGANNTGSLLPNTIKDGYSKSTDHFDLDPTYYDYFDSLLGSIRLENTPGSDVTTAGKQHSAMLLPEWAGRIADPVDLIATGGIVPTPEVQPSATCGSAPSMEQASGEAQYTKLLPLEPEIKKVPTEIGRIDEAEASSDTGASLQWQEVISSPNNGGTTEVKSRKRKTTHNLRHVDEQSISNGIIAKVGICETAVAPAVKRPRCKQERESSEAETTTGNAGGKKKMSNKESAKRQREKKKAEFKALTLHKGKLMTEMGQLCAQIDELVSKLQEYQNQNREREGGISCGTFMEDLIRKLAPYAVIVTVSQDEDDDFAFKLPSAYEPHGNRVVWEDNDSDSESRTSTAVLKRSNAMRSTNGKRSNAAAAKQNREKKKAERNKLEMQIKKLEDHIPKLHLELSRLQKICAKWKHVNSLRNFILSGNFQSACKGVVAVGRECSCMNFTIPPWFYKVFISKSEGPQSPLASSGAFIQQLIFSGCQQSLEIDFRAERVVLA